MRDWRRRCVRVVVVVLIGWCTFEWKCRRALLGCMGWKAHLSQLLACLLAFQPSLISFSHHIGIGLSHRLLARLLHTSDSSAPDSRVSTEIKR